jgi:alcohol dehydrogenase (cytochrome c)
MKKLLLTFACAAGLWAQSSAQGVDTAMLLERLGSSWPQHNGDYTGQRFSPLKQINTSNVASLTRAWAFETRTAIKATTLMVDGVVYFSVPDNVWAADARTGKEIWHFSRTSLGDHLASRGVTLFKNQIYFGTPDAHLISLDAKTGAKKWEVVVADWKFGYYISAAPLVVKDKLLVGMSGDQLDMPGFLEARGLNDGKLVWRWDAIPKPGEPGSETWPNKEIMAHGGGATWVQGVYDPQLNLTYWGTGNPHPVHAGNVRKGANLYTCSLVALDVDTGKMKWYIQTSPHDTHDRDANQTPIQIDADYQGRPRKLIAMASRSGYYFLLDRATGESLVTVPYGGQNWSAGVDKRGQPIPREDVEPTVDGAFFEGTTTNWYSPSYSPDTKLFYVNASHGFSIGYLMPDPETGKVEDHQGGGNTSLWSENMLLAIDYQTGKIRWSRVRSGAGGGNGILTTAGGLVFTNESGRLVALDAATGKMLWHGNPGGNLSGAPMTYELDGRQFVVTPVGGWLYAWALPERPALPMD